MRLQWTGTVRVVRYLARVEVARWRPDPVFPAICRSALERGRFDEEAVVEALGDGIEAPARRRLLAHCDRWGLRREGEPTAWARRCAQLERAPEPEAGTYELWVADHPDPSLRGLLLHAERRWLGDLDGKAVDLHPLPPDWPEPQAGPEAPVLESVRRAGERWSFGGFLGARRGGPPMVALCGEQHWPVVRTLLPDDPERPDVLGFDLPDGSDGETRWVERPGPLGPEEARRLVEEACAGLARSLRGRWVASEGRLRLRFDEGVAAAAGEAFALDLELDGPADGPADGTGWTGGQLLQAPVGPARRQDAEAWARALLLRRLDEHPDYFVAAATLAGWHAELAALPALTRWQLEPPKAEDLLRSGEGGFEAERTMALAAAVDLAP